MKIAFNPSTVAALTSPPNNKDITFDLKGRNIFARGVKFYGTDTNTWRDIKINNVSIGSHTLDLRNGSNTTLTNTNGVVTINSTWRPVVDNLTSDSTTSSLSAKQGKVLKALIDNKSNSGHTHDDRYLKLTGGTLTGNLTGTSATFSGRFYGNGDDEGIIIKPASDGYAGLTLGAHDGERSVFYFTKGNPFWRYNNGTNNLDIKHPKKAGTIALTSDIPTKSSWNYDDRYLRLSGGTMNSDALIKFANSGSWGTDKGPQGARGGLYWSGQSDYAKLYAEETAADNLDLVIQFGDDNSNGLSIRNKANTQTSYISASGVITTGIFKGNLDWSYITNKPSSYTPSAHTHAWNSLTHSSTTANQAILTNGSANGWKLYTLNIAAWDNAASKAHSHSNKAVIDGITSTHVSNWNTAYNFVNNITKADTDKIINKWDEIVNFLAGIDSSNKLNTLLNSKLSIQQLSAKDILTTKTNNALFWVNTVGTAGSITTGPFTDHPYALLSVTNYSQNDTNGKFFYRSRLAFSSAGDIKVASCHHQGEYKQDETWYNVLTSKNSGISGSTIKLNGSSITVYSSGTADGRYVKKSGDTMTGALNFANGTWNLVGDDSYMGDCNVRGHFGIKAANTTYPGIAFFNNANAHLGNLTAYSGNIKYGAYSLQFLDNGNTSVGASNWINPFSVYDKNAVKDGQAIYVWGQYSILGNLASDMGNISLWLKRVNAKTATLNMVLDGEYYANGTQRLAHISEIPSSLKNPYALTISLNGTSQGPYDGSAAKSINITPGSIGAATSGHNHDGRYVYNYGGTQMDGASRNKNALGMSTTSGISGNQWHILQAAWNDEYRWNSQIAFPTQNRNGMYYRSGLDDNTKWGAWVKLLDTGNSYVTNGKGVINGTTITQVDNADKVDGEHASSFVRAGAIEVGSPDLNALDTYSFIKSVNSQVAGHSPKGNIGWYNVIQLVHKNGAYDGPSYIGQIALGMTTNTNDMFFRGKRTDSWKTVIHSGNIGSQTVANAYHLRINFANSWSTWYWAGQSGQPSWLWGSNDGTNMYVWNPSNFNVNTAQYLRSLGNKNCQTGRTQAYGDVYTYNTHDSNTGSATTYSSVIGFGRGTGGTVEIAGGWCNTNLYWRSLRDCCEDWFSWRTILDESNYASVLNNTYLPLAGGTMKGNARIGHGSGSLYIGNSGNDGWLYVQNMASQAGEANWKIYTTGFATFKNLTVNGPTVVNGTTTLNGATTLNGLVTNHRGILPASYDVNKNNTGCYVWGDAMSTGVTAITDALDPNYVSVHYSNDNGASWTNFNFNSSSIFSLYANNGSKGDNFYLGHQGVAESLTQVQKNQLMVTFEIPSTMYSALCWASIDIDQGVQTVCTVEIIAKDGTIKNTFTKNLFGWNSLNYINFWGNNSPVINIGHDVKGKFVRFKFKHDAGNTDVRNASIRKIRLFSFTKYVLNINDPRSLMAYTGHLYTYDQNLNVKFPKALNVGGTLTITPTSNGYYGEANYPGAVIDTYYNNNYLQIGKSNGELIFDTNSDKGNINPALYIKDFISANRLFKFNRGLAVPPVHFRSASNADATITIQGENYNAYYVGTQENAIGKSFILADNIIDQKQVIVIRKGADGEVCFIKDAGEETFRYYLQNTQLMLAGGHTIQKSGTFSSGFDDGRARFIIYSERNNTWYEFYCG